MTNKTTIALAIVLAIAILGSAALLASSINSLSAAAQTAAPAITTPANAEQQPAPAAVEANDETLTVTSNGLISVAPDKARVSIDLRLEGDSSESIRNELRDALNGFIEDVKALGIEAMDITTNSFNINADYYSYDAQRRYSGYTSVYIVVRDIDNVAKLVDLATLATGYSSCYYSFDLEDRTQAYAAAVEQAAQEAAQKAENIASSMGRAVGHVVSVTEYEGYGTPLSSRSATMADSGSIAVESGMIEVRASLTVVYSLEN